MTAYDRTVTKVVLKQGKLPCGYCWKNHRTVTKVVLKPFVVHRFSSKYLNRTVTKVVLKPLNNIDLVLDSI